MSYCLQSVGHLIGWCYKGNFSGHWETNALVDAEGQRIRYERSYVLRKELEDLFEAPWIFDCPICHDVDCVVAELDTGALDRMEVKPIRMACTNCGFVVANSKPYLSLVLLERQIAGSIAKILNAFGVM